MPFVQAEFAHTCMHRAMQAFLLQQEEIDNVQDWLSFLSMFQFNSFYPLLWQTGRVFEPSLTAGKIVQSVTLPASVTQGRLHIFAAGIG